MSTSPAPVFDELRELCAAAGDKASLAIGMAGLVQEHMRHGRMREASRLASETMALVESIGDPTLTVALSLAAIATKIQTGEMADTLRWSQTVIDLADGDPTKGNIVFGSPLAMALATRGTARWALGRAGWRDDYDRALAMARSADPMSHAVVITFTYGFAIPAGVLLADDAALRDIEEALEITERSSEDFALGLARWALGIALVHRESSAERERGLAVLGQVRDMCLHGRFYVFMLPVVDVLHREGAGQVRRPRRCHTPNARSDRRSVPIRTARDLRPGDRRSGGDAAGARCRRRRRRSRGRDRRVGGRPGRRGAGDTRHLAAADARAAGPRARRREPPTATIGIATAPWRHRLASKGIWRGPRRCHDGGCSFGGGDVSVHRY